MSAISGDRALALRAREQLIHAAAHSLDEARPRVALRYAALAELSCRSHPELRLRALDLLADAYALTGAIDAGRRVAHLANDLATSQVRSTLPVARARLRLCEMLEISGRLHEAVDVAAGLVAECGRDEPDIGLAACNHLLSLAVKLDSEELAHRGVVHGRRVVDEAREPDQRAAWLQWWAIWEAHRGDGEFARARLDESHAERAQTPRRQLTRAFPEAHVLFTEGRSIEALQLLDSAIAEAERHGFLRHAAAGRALRQRLFIDAGRAAIDAA